MAAAGANVTTSSAGSKRRWDVGDVVGSGVSGHKRERLEADANTPGFHETVNRE